MFVLPWVCWSMCVCVCVGGGGGGGSKASFCAFGKRLLDRLPA